MGGMGGGLTGPAIGVGVGAFHSASLAFGLVGAAISGSYLLARTIYGRIVRGRGERLHELMSRLVEHASATAVRAPGLSRPVQEPRSLEGGGKAFDR